MKLSIVKFNDNLWEDSNDEVNDDNKTKEDVTHITKGYNNIELCIDGEFCIDDDQITQTTDNLNKMKLKKFSPYDYTLLYEIANDTILCLVKDQELCLVEEDF